MADGQAPMHRAVLPDGWKRAADDLAARDVLTGFYLAGGTGLALQLGHRRSVDLDFFSHEDFDPSALNARLAGVPSLKVRQVLRGTLHLEVHGILVSFLHYPYPLLFQRAPFDVFQVADARDIACMKLGAIAARGSRRDFVDLHVAAGVYGLPEILAWFETKYASTPYNRVHLFKAMTYFFDAERQPMPEMLVALDWDAVKQYLLAEVPRLSRLV